MVTEIRLYVEGARDTTSSSALRNAFGAFLRAAHDEARRRGVRWKVIACGSREEALRDFRIGCRNNPGAANLLLVDAEGPVDSQPREHLVRTLRRVPDDLMDEQVHLMVQSMEAWLIADPDALARYYRDGFNPRALPAAPNVETVPKGDLVPALERATTNTQKGKYHKTRHAFHLLGMIDPARVKERAPHCRRLFDTLRTLLDLP